MEISYNDDVCFVKRKQNGGNKVLVDTRLVGTRSDVLNHSPGILQSIRKIMYIETLIKLFITNCLLIQ